MKILLSRKIRIYPNKTQAELINQWFGNARFLWNKLLEKEVELYNKEKKFLWFKDLYQEMKILKEEFEFLKSNPFHSLTQVCKDLDKALKDCGKKTKKFPKFKKKFEREAGIYFENSISSFIEGNLKLSKLGRIKWRGSPLPEGRFYSGRIVRTSTGKFFFSAVFECEQESLPSTGKSISVDLGLKTFATCFDGEKFFNFDSPAPYKKVQKKLRKAQRKLSRKKKGSNRYKKQKIVVAKIHEKISNIRSNFLHNLTSQMITKFDRIVIEDLNVKGMMKLFGKAVADSGFYEFRRQLTYKSEWYGKELILADRWFPSSKTCSCCGTVKEKLKLSERTFVCSDCGFSLDMDQNAARNLLRYGEEHRNRSKDQTHVEIGGSSFWRCQSEKRESDENVFV